MSGLKDNHRRGKVGDFLDDEICPGAALSFVPAYFILRAALQKLHNLGPIRIVAGQATN